MWHDTGHRAEVTCILRSPQKDHFAVGYADGSIRLWSASVGSVITTFNGHKKAVSALAFDQEGTRLASGSQDTDLIVWDIVAEAGLYRYDREFTTDRNESIIVQASRSPRPNYCNKIHSSDKRCPFHLDGFHVCNAPDHVQRHVYETLEYVYSALHADYSCTSLRHMGNGC